MLNIIFKSNQLSINRLSRLNNLLNLSYFQISSRKFHELTQQIDQDKILYKIDEQNILSRYLSSQNKINKQKSLFKSQSLTQQQKKLQQKINYKQILAENSRGSILNQQYKNVQLCLIGMNYNNVSYEKLYKSILKFQPDCILIQNKPQFFNKDFQIIKKDPKQDIFSDKLYLKQLDLNQSINIKKNFSSQKVLNNLQSLIFSRKRSKTQEFRQFFPFLSKQLLNQKPLITSIYNNIKTSSAIYLCELPQSVYREWIINSHSLMQLQQIFKITTKSLPLYSGIANLTPLKLASYLFPQQFLSINDKYMSTLIQMCISSNYKRIMLMSSVASNQVISKTLNLNKLIDQQNNIKPLLTYLIAEKVKGNILRDYDPLQIIQKHILFDTMYHGKDIKNIKVNEFKTTNKIIQKYAANQPKQLIFKFRYQMTMKYNQMLTESIQEGINRKKKQFMRQAIRPE